jgi:hypothetical protein
MFSFLLFNIMLAVSSLYTIFIMFIYVISTANLFKSFNHAVLLLLCGNISTSIEKIIVILSFILYYILYFHVLLCSVYYPFFSIEKNKNFKKWTKTTIKYFITSNSSGHQISSGKVFISSLFNKLLWKNAILYCQSFLNLIYLVIVSYTVGFYSKFANSLIKAPSHIWQDRFLWKHSHCLWLFAFRL